MEQAGARRWVTLITHRIIRLVVVLAVVVGLTFIMVHLVPGDPARRIAGLQADPAAVERVRHEALLDRPLVVQFGHYLDRLAHGDLGVSYVTRESVWRVIGDRIGPTAQIAGIAGLIVVVVGISLGLLAGLYAGRRQRAAELAFSTVTGVLSAIPHYLTATFLAYLFAVVLGWFPVAGSGSLRAAILPAIAISVWPVALVARVVRVQTLAVLAEDHVRTARSKWLGPWRLYGRHVLPHVLASALTLIGLVFAGLIGGAVVVEQVFARAGIGTALVQAVLVGDYPVVQGITLLVATAVVCVNTGVDLMLARLDPRTLVAGS